MRGVTETNENYEVDGTGWDSNGDMEVFEKSRGGGGGGRYAYLTLPKCRLLFFVKYGTMPSFFYLQLLSLVGNTRLQCCF